MLKQIEAIQVHHFAFPAAANSSIKLAGERGVPDTLLQFYGICDGALIGEGNDFPAPDGRRFRLAIPRLSKLDTVQNYGFIRDDSPLFEASSRWWQILDYGDGNWLALDVSSDGNGRVLDIFHETVGGVGTHDIVATSFNNLLERLLAKNDIYWFDDDFEAFGIV